MLWHKRNEVLMQTSPAVYNVTWLNGPVYSWVNLPLPQGNLNNKPLPALEEYIERRSTEPVKFLFLPEMGLL